MCQLLIMAFIFLSIAAHVKQRLLDVLQRIVTLIDPTLEIAVVLIIIIHIFTRHIITKTR